MEHFTVSEHYSRLNGERMHMESEIMLPVGCPWRAAAKGCLRFLPGSKEISRKMGRSKERISLELLASS